MVTADSHAGKLWIGVGVRVGRGVSVFLWVRSLGFHHHTWMRCTHTHSCNRLTGLQININFLLSLYKLKTPLKFIISKAQSMIMFMGCTFHTNLNFSFLCWGIKMNYLPTSLTAEHACKKRYGTPLKAKRQQKHSRPPLWIVRRDHIRLPTIKLPAGNYIININWISGFPQSTGQICHEKLCNG